MNLAKVLIEAYPGDVGSKIPEKDQVNFGTLAEFCLDSDGVDPLFVDVVLSIYESGHDEMTDGDFLPIAVEVLKSYRDDIDEMLMAAQGQLAERTGIWVIRSKVEKDDETDEPLFWANDQGWVDRGSATYYRGHELQDDIVHLPADAEWALVGWEDKEPG